MVAIETHESMIKENNCFDHILFLSDWIFSCWNCFPRRWMPWTKWAVRVSAAPLQRDRLTRRISARNSSPLSSNGTWNSFDARIISDDDTRICRSQKVATKSREKKRGIAELHYILAKKFEAEGDFNAARVHYLLSEQPEVKLNLLDFCRIF